MNEIVDRVARALCDFDIGKDAWDYTGQHECRDDYRALARIAIKAMQQPTIEMGGVGYAKGWQDGPVEVYKAMIGAVLK
jgi:hypothetical protein